MTLRDHTENLRHPTQLYITWQFDVFLILL